ncbi:MAG: hypothetical protein Q7S95_02835 [bacterium]|nr:hypothetical protein [bacterium]
MATDVLSFGRMFGYRAATLATYIALFYVLVALGLPGSAALIVLIGGNVGILFFILKKQTRWDSFDLIANAAVMGIFTCGILPYAILDENRDSAAPFWAYRIFISSLAEAVFFLAALGAFGEKLAEPSLAIAIGVAVFMVQVSVLAAGFDFAKSKVAKK